MIENTDSQLFASLAIVVGILAPLVAGGLFVEYLVPRANRDWRKRLRRIEAGRARQAREADDRYDEDRKRASEWVASHCFWRQP